MNLYILFAGLAMLAAFMWGYFGKRTVTVPPCYAAYPANPQHRAENSCHDCRFQANCFDRTVINRSRTKVAS